MKSYPRPPFPDQHQTVPGLQQQMNPRPDCGEESYEGSDRLAGKVALITGGGAIANFTAGLAQLLGEKGIRVNSVAPGPIWTPLIVSTMTSDDIRNFGSQTPLGRPGQPSELASLYVLLASDESSYISGSRIGVTGGKPIL